MVSIAELKENYAVINDKLYGECIVIPASEFGRAWEEDLKAQGCKIFQGTADSRAAFFVKLPTEKTETAEEPREVFKPQPVPMHDPERRWNPIDDATLINLWEANKLIDEIAKHFPNRTAASVKARLQRLRRAGKIEGRYGGPKRLKKKFGRPRKPESPPLISKPVPPEPPTPQPQPATAAPTTTGKEPFNIRTTLQINLSVDCSDRNAVANFLDIAKQLGSLTRKEA